MRGDSKLNRPPTTQNPRRGGLGLRVGGGPPVSLGLHLDYSGLDDPLRSALGNWSTAVAGVNEPKTLLDKLLLHLDDDTLTAIAEAMYDHFATDATVPGKKNIVTGDPVTNGKIGPDGRPRQADGTPMLDNVDD